MIIVMRTTLTLPDDVYNVAKDFAHERRIPLGDASGGTRAPGVAAGTRLITLEETLAAEEDL